MKTLNKEGFKYRYLRNPFMDVSPVAQNTIDLYLLFSVCLV
jgi:hypothetical protein